MNEYYPGNVIKVRVEFTNKDTGEFVDPTTVTAKVKDPLGVISSYIVTGGQIVRDALGKFSLEIQPDLQGAWSYEWKGAGTNKGADANEFKIRESQFD